MSQVGRADSKMTLDVYAQLEQRADRTTSFDALLRRAGRQRGDVDWATARQKSNSTHHRDQRKAPQKTALCRHIWSGETRTRTGDTTIFSRAVGDGRTHAIPGNQAVLR